MTPDSRHSEPLVRRSADDDEPLFIAVSDAVSDAMSVPIAELPPLGFVVDADALGTVFDTRSPSGRLTFEYAGMRVVVHADRTVDVYEE